MNEFVRQELEKGRLRQGWSCPGLSLLDASGVERGKEDWYQSYPADWDKPKPRLYSTLRRMLKMKEGDLVICPKAPDDSHFTIVRVCGDYRFEVAPGQGDFGHIIPVKDQKVVSYWHNQDSETIRSLFKRANHRPPITPVSEYMREDVISAAEKLWREEDTTKPSSPRDLLNKLLDNSRKDAARFFIKEVNGNKWDYHRFEKAVGEAFKRKGYERLWGNDARGGAADADHVFSLPLPGLDDRELLDHTPLIIVQVKHKQGRDDNDVEGVKQLAKWKLDENEEANYTVLYRILFSSAESFTKDCKKAAEENDVILICGAEAGLFMLD